MEINKYTCRNMIELVTPRDAFTLDFLIDILYFNMVIFRCDSHITT